MKIDGGRIKARRLAMKLSQAELASAAGITQSHLAKVESGKVLGRTRDLQDKLARALKTTVETICIEDGAEASEVAEAVPRASPEAEAMLLEVFDKAAGHSFADVDAVRLVVADAVLLSPLVARRLLDAAAALRGRGLEATSARLAVEVAGSAGPSPKGNPLQHGSTHGGRM